MKPTYQPKKKKDVYVKTGGRFPAITWVKLHKMSFGMTENWYIDIHNLKWFYD